MTNRIATTLTFSIASTAFVATSTPIDAFDAATIPITTFTSTTFRSILTTLTIFYVLVANANTLRFTFV